MGSDTTVVWTVVNGQALGSVWTVAPGQWYRCVYGQSGAGGVWTMAPLRVWHRGVHELVMTVAPWCVWTVAPAGV